MLVLATVTVVLDAVYLFAVTVGWLNASRDGISFAKYVAGIVPFILGMIFGILYLATRVVISEVP